MLLLVDGYNVLYAWDGAKAGQRDRDGLLALLSQFARIRGHEITVVFDGGMFSWHEGHSYDKRVKVIYSGSVDDADTVLKNMLTHMKFPHTVLVSSDADIAQCASLCGVVSIDSHVFLRIVYERLRKSRMRRNEEKATVRKRSGAGTPELDKLMMQSLQETPMPHKDDNEQNIVRNSDSEKSSKAERKMRIILEKL